MLSRNQLPLIVFSIQDSITLSCPCIHSIVSFPNLYMTVLQASQNRTRYRWDAALGEVSYIEVSSTSKFLYVPLDFCLSHLVTHKYVGIIVFLTDWQAFQRVSMFPVIEEGLSNFDIMGMDKPIAVYKYIVRFTREANVSSST